MFQFGSAQWDITPPLGTRLAGQFEDRFAEAIHDRLCARAMVMDDGRIRLALVSCDLSGIRRQEVVEARTMAAQETGIPTEHILIAATHTHTGPMVTDSLSRSADEAYVALLPRAIASAIRLAVAALQPALVGVGSGREDSASHNRRYLRRDGSARMHPPKGDPDFVGPEGPDDPEVGVLFALDQRGQLLGGAVNYTSHPIVVGHESAVSADYPGQVARALQALKGPQAVMLFFNGAAGNTCPIDVHDLHHREYGWRWVERVGNLLAAQALRVIETVDPVGELRLAVASRQVELRIREITEEQIQEAATLVAQGDAGPLREHVYAREVLLLADERRQSPLVPAEVQVMALGDAALVGIPGELFVEFGLEIKRRSPFRHTYIVELANGRVGYLPTALAFAHGGYETRLARSSKLIPEAGEQLTGTAISLLQQLHKED